MMASTQRPAGARPPLPGSGAGVTRGLAGYRYLLALVLLMLLSSGSMLLLVTAGASTLGHSPVRLPELVAPADPEQSDATGRPSEPFFTHLPAPVPVEPPEQARDRLDCRAVRAAR